MSQSQWELNIQARKLFPLPEKEIMQLERISTILHKANWEEGKEDHLSKD